MKLEETIRTKLLETRAESTVSQYMKRIQKLNDDKPIKSLAFLKDYDGIKTKINSYGLSETSKVNYYIVICAVLKMYKNYKKIYDKYLADLKGVNKIIEDGYKNNEKNEKQKQSVVPMNDILSVKEALFKELESYENKEWTKKMWEKLLQHLLISLYTQMPTRRNKDYAEMFVTYEEPTEMDSNKNYYVATTGDFIFNNYKTAKKHKQQRYTAPECMKRIMDDYITKYILIVAGDSPNDADEFPLLVDRNGKRLHSVVGIYNTLHRAFGKKIGSSALRHIFLTEKYGAVLNDMKDTAEKMAHSLSTQKKYIVNN